MRQPRDNDAVARRRQWTPASIDSAIAGRSEQRGRISVTSSRKCTRPSAKRPSIADAHDPSVARSAVSATLDRWRRIRLRVGQPSVRTSRSAKHLHRAAACVMPIPCPLRDRWCCDLGAFEAGHRSAHMPATLRKACTTRHRRDRTRRQPIVVRAASTTSSDGRPPKPGKIRLSSIADLRAISALPIASDRRRKLAEPVLEPASTACELQHAYRC